MTYDELRESVAEVNRTIRELNGLISELRDEFDYEPFDRVSILVGSERDGELPQVSLIVEETP